MNAKAGKSEPQSAKTGPSFKQQQRTAANFSFRQSRGLYGVERSWFCITVLTILVFHPLRPRTGNLPEFLDPPKGKVMTIRFNAILPKEAWE